MVQGVYRLPLVEYEFPPALVLRDLNVVVRRLVLVEQAVARLGGPYATSVEGGHKQHSDPEHGRVREH